ncbi:MAG: helix-turn-helix domain-containing protein [Clostridiales bacterium]|nr:helix-turn-helix domain-containing protein [Clostridiales bacterium]
MKRKMNVALIAEYITANQLTVKEFCKRCDISVSTYYRIMQGNDCKLLSLFRIAKTMNVLLQQFFN